jgi:hypothetical protein
VSNSSSKVGSLPGEGTGTTRKIERLFDRPDEKLSAHNDLDRWRQENFHSVWRNLKLLSGLSPVSR